MEQDAYKAAQTETDLPDIEEINMPGVEEAAPGGIKFDLGFLATKTGPGSVNDYIDHPLNFKQSKGMAQMIRGFTGLAGELDLAIVDITLGAFQFVKEEKGYVKTAAVNTMPE